MAPANNSRIIALEELSFADSSYPWDESAARQRLLESMGWAALAAYSLAIDTLKDSQSFQAYKLLVVDLLEGEPRIVPRALEDARASLGQLEGNMRETAEVTLNFLESKYARAGEAALGTESDYSKNEDEPQTFSTALEEGSGEPDSEQSIQTLPQAQALVASLESRGCVVPAWGREALVQFVAGLSTEESISSPGGFGKLSPRDYFVRIMETLPALVPSGELSTSAKLPENTFESLGRRIASSLGKARQG